jgi:hypothetical protein
MCSSKDRDSLPAGRQRRTRLPTVSLASTLAARRSISIVSSTEQKMEEINRLLRSWRWSFPALVEWHLGREEKAEEIGRYYVSSILSYLQMHCNEQDADHSVSKAMLPFLVNNIRQELGNLQHNVPVSGQWSAEVEFESLEI